MIARGLLRTGIPGMDDILNGGAPQGSIITLSGPTGCGKSTLGMQFLIEGIRKYKQPGLYIAIEETRSSMLGNLAGFGWDFERLEKEKQFMFLDYPLYEVDQFLQQNNAIGEIIATLGIKRVVVDSIMPVALHFPSDDERKKGFLKLMDSIRRWGTTTLIISEDTPATVQDIMPNTRYGLETLTDGWIHMYYLYSAKTRERTRAIEVIKMKGAPHSSKIHACAITRSGFVMDRK